MKILDGVGRIDTLTKGGKMNFEQARYYLSAMIDGEGHVGCTTGMRKSSATNSGLTPYKNRQVVIYSCDIDLMWACMECCEILEIPYKYYMTERKEANWNNQHELRVTHRTGFNRLYEVLDLKSLKKKKALEEIVNSYA